MEGMFNQALKFNRDIGDWDTSKVTDISYMFYYAKSFNQYLGYWNMSNIKNRRDMFYGSSCSIKNCLQ